MVGVLEADLLEEFERGGVLRQDGGEGVTASVTELAHHGAHDDLGVASTPVLGVGVQHGDPAIMHAECRACSSAIPLSEQACTHITRSQYMKKTDFIRYSYNSNTYIKSK